MSERFFLPSDLNAAELQLAGQEAHHLAHVLRLGVGRTVVLFDGQGNEAEAVIESVSKREVRLRPGPVRRPPRPMSVSITLAVAPPKGDRFRWLVEKATELGVRRLVPLITERTIVHPREGKLEKLRQTVIAACKQSGRSELMELMDPIGFSRMCDGFKIKTSSESPRALILQPGGDPLARVLADASPSPTILLIGPEGGFTDSEIELARSAGVRIASLGRTILRTETAAIAAAAVATQDELRVES